MPRLLLFDNNSKYLPALISRLEQLGAEIQLADPLGSEQIHDYSGLVISGRRIRPASVEVRRKILRTYRNIFLDSGPPIFAICFGCEVFAFSYGASVKRMEKGEFGEVEIRFFEEYPLAPGLKSMRVYQSHVAEIKSLPSQIKNYASSELCMNQVLKHVSKPQFAVQFHPERTTRDVLLENFVKYCCK